VEIKTFLVALELPCNQSEILHFCIEKDSALESCCVHFMQNSQSFRVFPENMMDAMNRGWEILRRRLKKESSVNQRPQVD